MSCPYPFTVDPRLVNQTSVPCVLQCPTPLHGTDKDQALVLVTVVLSGISIVPIAFLLATQVLALIKQKKQFGDRISNSLLISLFGSLLVISVLLFSTVGGDHYCNSRYEHKTPRNPSCFSEAFFSTFAAFFLSTTCILLYVHLAARLYISRYPEYSKSKWALLGYHCFLWAFCCILTALLSTQLPWGPNVGNSCSTYPHDDTDWWWIFGTYIVPVTVEAFIGVALLSLILGRVIFFTGWKSIRQQIRIITMISLFLIIVGIRAGQFFWTLNKRDELKDSYSAWVLCAVTTHSEKEAFQKCSRGTHVTFVMDLLSTITVSGVGIWTLMVFGEVKDYPLGAESHQCHQPRPFYKASSLTASSTTTITHLVFRWILRRHDDTTAHPRTNPTAV